MNWWLIPVSAFLWRLGGSGAWLGKAPRRFILPVVIALATWLKRRKWTSFLAFPALVVAFSLGYGEDHPYWQKFLVGCSWVIPSIFIKGFTPLVVIIPVVWIIMFRLSNWKPTEKIFAWHYVEPTIGGLIGWLYA